MNALGAVALLIVALLFVNAKPSQAVDDYCFVNAADRENVRVIMLEAFDQALKQHLVHIFEVWVKGSAEHAGRARAGAHLGIGAYVEIRAEALKWNPPLCSERN